MVSPNPQASVTQWIAKQNAATPLLASIIARELRDTVDPISVAEVLAKLSASGMIVPVFAVRVPSGVVLRRVYRSLNEIEPQVRDQLNRPISRDDLEVLPAFAKAGK